jgi:uncharacterized protein (DUF952 family)
MLELMSEPASCRTIYKILSAEAWQQALERGMFAGSEHDVRDGFIHFSTSAQVAETAAKHFARIPELVLLSVSVDALAHALRWESSRGGALFPHLYGELPTSAVTRVDRLALDADGVHLFPSELGS